MANSYIYFPDLEDALSTYIFSQRSTCILPYITFSQDFPPIFLPIFSPCLDKIDFDKNNKNEVFTMLKVYDNLIY